MLMEDGFSTIITFSEDATVEIEEIEVTPPGMDSGELTSMTTMRNVAWRTKGAKKLKELTSGSVTYAYDPICLTKLLAMVGVNQLLTYTWPDGSTWTAWGVLRSFIPGAQVEGERPSAEATIEFTNRDDTGAEVAPAYTPPAP